MLYKFHMWFSEPRLKRICVIQHRNDLAETPQISLCVRFLNSLYCFCIFRTFSCLSFFFAMSIFSIRFCCLVNETRWHREDVDALRSAFRWSRFLTLIFFERCLNKNLCLQLDPIRLLFNCIYSLVLIKIVTRNLKHFIFISQCGIFYRI